VTEHVDVLVVGAGLAGIGAACHLLRDCPSKRFAVLEARDCLGGTWDLFRYPGIRSDSDMFTLSYRFRPWPGATSIADGPSILSYLRDTAREYGLDEFIRYRRRAIAANWSSARARWTVDVEDTDTGAIEQITCDFLWGNTGYYRYDEGYTPAFAGVEQFAGRVVHPQHWPADLDVNGRRVVVIGSGATAITLVPALAETGAQVTMLQRSPSYVVPRPRRDPLAVALRRLPARQRYWLVRWKNVLVTQAFYELCRRWPGAGKRIIRSMVARQLPDGPDVDTHFAPRYDPWDQRLCVARNADLFRVLRDGTAHIVTDRIDRFTENGIRLESGRELEADVVVTATGLVVSMFGGAAITIDGVPLDMSERVAYKGVLLSGVPNAAMTIGYTNASWTLKAELVAEYVCRLLNHMQAHGYHVATPRAPAPGEPTQPAIALTSGYVQRALGLMARQGSRPPWRLHQNYPLDIVMLRHGRLDDAIDFERAPRTAATPAAR
jgi:cation diffusion facilitator CzcD-associated flavoprotein CzcO